MMSGWQRVTRLSRCPVCGKPDWCVVSEDGSVAICMRVEGGRRKTLRDGSVGWLHEIDESRPVLPPSKPSRPQKIDAAAVASQMFAAPEADDARIRLAESLGVSVESLTRLGVGFGRDHDGRTFTSWPIRNAELAVVGVMRRYADGGKKTMRGTSASGVFVAEDWLAEPGPALIVEGGSDVAAAITAGRCAIGRPSCVGGVAVVAALLLASGRTGVVCAENDYREVRTATHDPDRCDGCRACMPGLAGARTVLAELRRRGTPVCPHVWLPPRGAKDARDVVRAGQQAKLPGRTI